MKRIPSLFPQKALLLSVVPVPPAVLKFYMILLQVSRIMLMVYCRMQLHAWEMTMLFSREDRMNRTTNRPLAVLAPQARVHRYTPTMFVAAHVPGMIAQPKSTSCSNV
jgi:hypothetical protein